MATADQYFREAKAHPECEVRHARILIVDDEQMVRELLARKLRSLGYQCDTSGDPLEALQVLSSSRYDLLIADVMMPRMRGTTLMKEALRACEDLAVILVTSVVDVDVAVGTLKDGAYDYIAKPFHLDDISISVARALEKRRLVLENREYQRVLKEGVANRTAQLKDALHVLRHTYHSTLLALGTALDSREADSEGHLLRVTLYTTRIAKALGVTGQELPTIEQGALLHDIGKIGVPDEILRKPGRLTDAEWKLMRRHPEIGFNILSGIRFLEGAARIVLHHQERFDGSGYPAGLQGEEITLGARIFAVADVLECMTSDRPFQKAVSFEDARSEIIRVSGSQLDPGIVQAFLEIPAAAWMQIGSGAVNTTAGVPAFEIALRS